MDISTKHVNAVMAACRIPALQARLALLDANTVNAQIDFIRLERGVRLAIRQAYLLWFQSPLAATAGTRRYRPVSNPTDRAHRSAS